MKRKALFQIVALAIISAVILFSQQKGADHNTLLGAAIDGDSGLPIADLTAAAFDANEQKMLYQSDPTDLKGNFKFIVPISERLFKLKIYDREDRYYVYQPAAVYTNDQHPRNFGMVKFYSMDKRPLKSQQEVKAQIRAAEIIRRSDSAAGALYLSRFGSEYTTAIQACPAVPFQELQLDTLSRPAFFAPPQPPSVPSVPARVQKRIETNERNVLDAISQMHRAERGFYDLKRTYGNGAELLEQGFLKQDMIYRAGYCIEPIAGTREGNRFRITASERNAYIVFSGPIFPGITGDLFFYSEQPGDIRYSSQPVRSLSDAHKFSGVLPSAKESR